ncbi:A/G-specific adenine glycosylase MutY [Thiobacillus denitrificans ATCC 25259]|uniref:Adenine DNA glycosylase n=1 Tax=Thiobacillus denitrificans (strain ATCC 25259 / T1) TaxID=292415 RepID=Q3SET8_THIDA|nr:A/G-specific adenine glycosylase [Thiobacillus denitrificans]AAZ98083.1 A/G-specific adenine glycosylase MutY [Thiobacillus denitrificans ATCC 25259]
MNSFASRIIQWQRCHGRHSLPWQATRDPYRIWLSEIMLQQTQVATVIPYYARFVARFPDLPALAAAHEDEVLALWSGLGYYSRARNLYAAARTVLDEHAGIFPDVPETIARLPGIGRSTAAAIAALAFGRACAILDGNVKRVLARHAGINGWPGERKVELALWQLAASRLPQAGVETYTQGMMDLGALVCTRGVPACVRCPVSDDCVARVDGRIEQLPTPRPRKALPEKEVQMLLFVEDGRLLLEKRPPRGIWGGLWSLPELPAEVDAGRHCRDHFGFRTISLRTLPRLSHTFTHFKLHIHPVRLDVSPEGSARPGPVWLPFSAALATGLPAPVRKLVLQLGEG